MSKVPNIVQAIINQMIDGAAVPLDMSPYSQGVLAERRRMRDILSTLRFAVPPGKKAEDLPTLGLEDVGGAMCNTLMQAMSREEWLKCEEYTNRISPKLGRKKIPVRHVLAVCAILIWMASQVQKDEIYQGLQNSQQ
jgi:hypothetical protein